jgi:hypothetical protein
VATETLDMPRKKTTPADDTPTSDHYRKPFKPARIRASLADIATDRAAVLAQDFTQYVNDALRMRLEAEGLWPPPPPKSR